MPFTLPDLPYAPDALEPHIDARTMEIHHTKHHNAYITKANAALEGTVWADKSIEEIIRNISDFPDEIQNAVRNNAGGHYNHSLFWKIMAPAGSGGGGEPAGDLGDAIKSAFGSFDTFKEKFANAGVTQFGSGWAWLCVKSDGQLNVCSTPNQDSPLMGCNCGGMPILGLDVWEHAYYLNYQNRRPDYIASWWNVVNWAQVSENYTKAKG